MKITLNSYNLYSPSRKKENGNNQTSKTLSQNPIQSDEFVSRSKKEIVFEGFWKKLFSKNRDEVKPEDKTTEEVNNPENETHNDIKKDEPVIKETQKSEIKPKIQDKSPEEMFSEELYNLVTSDESKLSEEEKDAKLKKVIEMLESPEYKPVKFKTNYNPLSRNTRFFLEDMAEYGNPKYRPYILLETFGSG